MWRRSLSPTTPVRHCIHFPRQWIWLAWLRFASYDTCISLHNLHIPHNTPRPITPKLRIIENRQKWNYPHRVRFRHHWTFSLLSREFTESLGKKCSNLRTFAWMKTLPATYAIFLEGIISYQSYSAPVVLRIGHTYHLTRYDEGFWRNSTESTDSTDQLYLQSSDSDANPVITKPSDCSV